MERYTSYIKYRLYEKLFHMESPQKAMDELEKEFSTSLVELEIAATEALLMYQPSSCNLH